MLCNFSWLSCTAGSPNVNKALAAAGVFTSQPVQTEGMDQTVPIEPPAAQAWPLGSCLRTPAARTGH